MLSRLISTSGKSIVKNTRRSYGSSGYFEAVDSALDPMFKYFGAGFGFTTGVLCSYSIFAPEPLKEKIQGKSELVDESVVSNMPKNI